MFHKNNPVMRSLRRMSVGEARSFPLASWGAARAGAFYLKRDFGSAYSVHRRPRNGQTIVVERLA